VGSTQYENDEKKRHALYIINMRLQVHNMLTYHRRRRCSKKKGKKLIEMLYIHITYNIVMRVYRYMYFIKTKSHEPIF